MASYCYSNLDEFNNLMNISNLIRKLDSDSNYSWFYEDARTLMVSLDMIFTSITMILRKTYAVETSVDLLNKLLIFLTQILHKWQSFPQNKDKLDKGRLCEILRIIVNSNKAKLFLIQVNAIVRIVLENFQSDNSSVALIHLFQDCLKKNIKNQNFAEICHLVKTGLNSANLYDQEAADCIIINFPRFVQNETVLSDVLIALQCLEKLYKIRHNRSEITIQLLTCAPALVRLSCHSRLKETSRLVLSEMIVDFTGLNNLPWKENYPNLNFLVFSLPSVLEDWPASQDDIFFVIAFMLDNCKKLTSLPWTPYQILLAIKERVEKQEEIIPVVLKTMCYFFSHCLKKYEKVAVLVKTSFRLINRLEHCGAFHDVITPYEGQLAWILKSSNASNSMKFMLLEAWLNDENTMQVLCNVLQLNGLEEILLMYIHKFPENATSKKAAIAASRIESAILPKKITLSLFQSLNCLELCSKLLLSKPAIPTNRDQGLSLCAAMGAILPYLNDKDVFVAACVFSTKLFRSLRHDPKALLQFCKNMSNVVVIFGAAASSDNHVAVCALHLLKTLLKFQILHQLNMADGFEANLVHLFKGSIERKKAALELTKLIITHRNTRNLYLNYTHNTCLAIYQKLHDFSGTELAETSYTCMLRMLAQNPHFLTCSVVTYTLMLLQWDFPLSCANSTSFLKFAEYWFRVVHRTDIFDLPQGMEECILLRMKSK